MPSVVPHALLLTGGLGTRLRPLTLVRAKPAIPVAGQPLARRIVRWMAAQGVRDIVSNLHYLPESIASVLGDGSDLGARIRYSWEQPVVLGSAGGPRHALGLIGSDTFFVVNGDTLTDVDLGALAAAHAASGALVTLALTRNHDAMRYTGVRLDGDRVLPGVVARGRTDVESYHFTGVQLVSAEAFRSVAPGVVAQSIGGVYDRLISEHRGSVRGFVSNAASSDIGTVSDYWTTSTAIRDAEAGGAPLTKERGLIVDPSARVHDSIVWDNVTIGADAVLEQCIVTDRVSVPPGARFNRMVLVQTHDGVMATPFAVNRV
jgi:NDP-sugar pyrophosphorylase family protein